MCLKFYLIQKVKKIISLQTRTNVERDWARVTDLLIKRTSQLREALIIADRCLDSV